jgi:hypothetical protein
VILRKECAGLLLLCLPRRCIDAASRMSRFIQIRSSITFIHLRQSVIHNHLPRNTRRRPHPPLVPLPFGPFARGREHGWGIHLILIHPFLALHHELPSYTYINTYTHCIHTDIHTPRPLLYFLGKKIGENLGNLCFSSVNSTNFAKFWKFFAKFFVSQFCLKTSDVHV